MHINYTANQLSSSGAMRIAACCQLNLCSLFVGVKMFSQLTHLCYQQDVALSFPCLAVTGHSPDLTLCLPLPGTGSVRQAQHTAQSTWPQNLHRKLSHSMLSDPTTFTFPAGAQAALALFGLALLGTKSCHWHRHSATLRQEKVPQRAVWKRTSLYFLSLAGTEEKR